LIVLPESALFDVGYLQRSCGEPISYQCPEDGGVLAYDGQGQFACSICFKVVEPIVTCVRCKEVLTVKPNHDERVCLSAQAYRNNKGNLLPAFAPTDEPIWAFRVSSSGLTQVATEVSLRNKFSNGDLSESTEVSSPQQDTFKLARDTVEFSDALVEGLRRASQREADARAERLKEHNLRASDAEPAPIITPPAPGAKGVAYKVFAVLLVILAIAAVGYAWNAKIEFDKKVAQIELSNQLQKQQDDLARKKLEIERAQKEEALRAQRLAEANNKAKEEAAKAAAAEALQIELTRKLQQQEAEFRRKNLQIEREQKEAALQAQRLVEANNKAKEEAARVAAAEALQLELTRKLQQQEAELRRKNLEIEREQKEAALRKLEDLSKNFVTKYFDTWSSNEQTSLNFVNNAYSNTVDFYGARVTNTEVIRQKVAFVKRWPVRTYKERSNTTVIQCNQVNKICSISGLVDWSAQSSERNAKSWGFSSYELVLDLADVAIRVIKEDGKTDPQNIRTGLVHTQTRPVEGGTTQRPATRGIESLDGAWYSAEWKYGYVLKNGVGTATSSNSQNFQVGQNIIQLRATSDTTFVGQQVYMDGKFYNVNVTLRPDGHLYFEGDRNVSWVMRRVVDKISVKAELYFALDQASISVEGQKLLDNVVSRASTIILESIFLQGFSASIGSAEDSRNLSLRRASAVKAYLVSRGVQPGTIYIEGKGAQNPAGDNNTAAGRAMNNRVLIEIIGARR